MKPSRTFKRQLRFQKLRGVERDVAKLLKELAASKSFSQLPPGLLGDLKLGIVEGVTNALHHGSAEGKKPVQVRFEATPKRIEVVVEDSGPGFSLAALLRRRSPSELESRGRGLLILKNLFDSVNYRRGRPNRLVLQRKLSRPKRFDDAIELFNLLQEGIHQLRPKHQLYERFIDFVVGRFNVQRASFLLFDTESGLLKVATSRGIQPRVAKGIAVEPGEGVSGFVFKTSRPLLVNNTSRVKRGTPKPRRQGYESKSFVSVPVVVSPLHLGEETIGVLNLTDKRDGSSFTNEELKILNLMATQAATAFRIRDLIDAVQSHERANREWQIVHEIQSRLLPISFPDLGDLEVAGRCQLSPRGGGDYYDVLKIDNVLRGVVADVSGHDVGSAITMASFRSIFRSMVFDPNSPGYLLQVLRWAMHEDLLKLHQFISCWIFEYKAPGKVKVSGAGHPPLLHFRRDLKKWQTTFSKHLPLGLEDESKPQNVAIALGKGDVLVIYTDGLFDPRMRATGFDKQTFCDFIENHLHLSTDQLAAEVAREVKPHHLALGNPDDIAFLILRRRS